MPAFKLRQLARPIQLELQTAWVVEGVRNWLPDYRLAARIRRRFGLKCKEDDVRRVCSDLARVGLIRKLPHKSMYKCKMEVN